MTCLPLIPTIIFTWTPTLARSDWNRGWAYVIDFGGLTIARRFRPQDREVGKRLRINELIRISPVRLINENDEQVGVVELEEARRLAREAGLDLVEVSPNTTPPVCRIMDYGKWKYQQKKKEQKARAHATKSELKGIRLRPKIDEHDLNIKLTKAREFLLDSNKVQFTMQFRGREMAHQDLGLRTMQEICDKLADVGKVEAPPRIMGRRMTMVLAPDRKPVAKEKKAESGGSGSEQAPAPQTQPQPTSQSA